MQNKNFFQTINSSSIFFVAGGLGKGLYDACQDINGNILEFILIKKSHFLLAVFILLFKIKTAIDDHAHFGEPAQKISNKFRNIGFILAVFSWVFLVIGAMLLGHPAKAAAMIILSLIISTSWIIVHLFELRAKKKSDPPVPPNPEAREKTNMEMIISLIREKWVLFNMTYIACLGIFIGWLDPVIKSESPIVLVILLVIFFFDYLSSRQSTMLNDQ